MEDAGSVFVVAPCVSAPRGTGGRFPANSQSLRTTRSVIENLFGERLLLAARCRRPSGVLNDERLRFRSTGQENYGRTSTRRPGSLDDADVSTRKISDQLGHSKVSMTQDRYLGCKLADRQTVLEKMIGSSDK